MHDDVKMGSERSFGLVFAAVFLVIALWPLLRHEGPHIWALVAAFIFAGLGLFAPRVLRPLNALWFRFGLLLAKVTTPVFLTLLYVLMVIPTGVLMRAFRKDPLARKPDPSLKSYWIARKEQPGSMRNQY